MTDCFLIIKAGWRYSISKEKFFFFLAAWKWDEQFYHGFCWNSCFFCILLVTSFFLNCTKMEWVLWKTVSFWNVCCHFSYVWLFATLWNIVPQASLSMGFSRQKHWSGLQCPPPGDLPDPGIKALSLMSPALAGGFFTTSTTWEAPYLGHFS